MKKGTTVGVVYRAQGPEWRQLGGRRLLRPHMRSALGPLGASSLDQTTSRACELRAVHLDSWSVVGVEALGGVLARPNYLPRVRITYCTPRFAVCSRR
eukprot:1195629-Prorocentrum_minimum.AAC.1